MPSLNREVYPHNAKITEFKCASCNTQAFARYKTVKWCSGLCKKNAYDKRKALKIIDQRDNHGILTGKSREFSVTKDKPKTKPEKLTIVGRKNVRQYFSDQQVKITLKALKEMEINKTLRIGSYDIKRISIKSWLIFH